MKVTVTKHEVWQTNAAWDSDEGERIGVFDTAHDAKVFKSGVEFAYSVAAKDQDFEVKVVKNKITIG